MEKQSRCNLARSISAEHSTRFRRRNSNYQGKLSFNKVAKLISQSNNDKQNQKSLRMKSNARPSSFISYICLAVILIDAASNVNFVQQVAANNSPFLFQSSASNMNNQSAVLFRDHSGPSSGKIQSLDVICGKNFMSVRAEFSAPFYGIVFSKGTFGQENCVYVKPGSGLVHAAFNVYYDQCGTKPDLEGKFYENTIVIQYGSDIIEAYDEAKRLRCEWFEAYEKPASFRPAIPVADLEVVEMNFQGDDIDCWMEIQEGIEPWGRPLNKMVPVGQPMTLVVAINDNDGQFDMRVKSCFAHDGVQKPIALTDEYGCVLRPKMLTTFTKIKNPSFNRNATVLSYSRFLTFKFPDSMSVQIQCTVEVCRNGCADACQLVASKAVTNIQSEVSIGAKPWFSGSSPHASIGAGDDAGGPVKRIEGAGDLAPNESQQLQRPMRVPFNQPPPQQQSQVPPQMREAFTGIELNENHAGSNNVNQVSIAKRPYHHRQRQQPPMLPPQVSVMRTPPARPRLTAQPEVSMAHNDMIGGSDSNRQPAIADASGHKMEMINHQPQQPTNRHVVVAAPPPPPAPSQAPSTTTTTTTTTSTARPAADSGEASSAESSPTEYDRAGRIEETPELASDDHLTRLSANSEPQQQQQQQQQQAAPASNVQREPERNEQPPASAHDDHQPSVVAQDEASIAVESVKREDGQQQSSNGGQQAVGGDQQAASSEQQPQQVSSEPAVAAANENRPSVQGYDENLDSSNNKPEAGEQLVVKNQQVGGAQNSLKTVELEVPANEDSISGLMASSSIGAGSRGGQSPFSSLRLSNVDSANVGDNDAAAAAAAASSFINSEQQNKEARLGAQSGSRSYNSPESVIQPREPLSNIERRDKGSIVNGEEGSSAVAASPISSAGKARFGTRSQPIVLNVQGAVEPPARHYSNHQQASQLPANDNADSVAPPTSANIDRVLTDRSDDLSGPTVDLASAASNDSVDKTASSSDGSDEVAASVQSSASAGSTNDESPNKPEFDSMRHRTSAIVPEESAASAPSDSAQSAADHQGSKQQVQPVVGTDELASGPVQFEARIGASPASSDSLEEALTKLQQQQLAPQTAALVSSQARPEGPIGSSDSSQASAIGADKLEKRLDAGQQQQPAETDKTEMNGQNDRLDVSKLLSLVKKQQPEAAKQQQVEGLAVAAGSQQQQMQMLSAASPLQQMQPQQQKSQNSQQAQRLELNQPYPNVAGQAKVMPDPNVHGPAMMAAQSATSLASILPAEQQQAINKQMAANKQQQSEQQQQSGANKQAASTLSPVSQMPFGIGFPKSHIQPAIQKLSQQFLLSQQQLAKQTTSKPTRGRFSLFSPHTALQAVASRFLSKTDTQQQPQQAQIPAAMRQMPRINANNVKLSSDQEQKLFLLSQQQAQAGMFPVSQQAQKLASQQQQYLPGSPMIVPQQQLYRPPQHWQQQQNQTGLLANHLQQQPKQMIRSRRSLVPSVDTVAQAIDEDLVDIGKESTAKINENNENNSNDQAKASANLGAADMPQIKIRRLIKGDAIYGICFPVFSLTFMITCVFWLIVFTTIYGIYYCISSKRQQSKQ